MTTCFLFIDQPDDESILSLSLDAQGQLQAPLKQRSSEEIKEVQTNAETIVVLPAGVCSLHEVSLPWLGERKARAAIPYALEEQLAQSVATLHFAFDRQHYSDNNYLVVVIDKAYLNRIVVRLESMAILFDCITLDWFALKEGECCLTQNTVLVHDKALKGALSFELATRYLNNNPITELITFKNSLPFDALKKTVPKESTAPVWIASRLQQTSPMNLCQGEFQKQDNKRKSTRFWYFTSAVLAGIWILSLLGLNTTKVIMLNHKIAQLDSQIAVIYREFFPNAQQVISPRFRIEQSLKAGSEGQESAFWMLLSTLAGPFNEKNITIEQILFHNQTLAVTIQSNDFSTLEALQQTLQQSNINVTQTRASSQDDQVVATLELKL